MEQLNNMKSSSLSDFTTIRLRKEVLKYMNSFKEHPRETSEQLILRMIKELQSKSEGGNPKEEKGK